MLIGGPNLNRTSNIHRILERQIISTPHSAPHYFLLHWQNLIDCSAE